jgi:hypothetical protein
LVAKASALAEREFQMNWGIRGSVLAAGAAALLSTQAVYAAPPAPRTAGVDPLVSLSVLSAPQPSAALLASTAAVQNDEASPKALNPLIIVLGLVVFAGLVAALISGGGNAHGDFTPVSPA